MNQTTWQAEHRERQERLVVAIDAHYTSDETAEVLDDWDNTIRLLWATGNPALFISQN